MEETQKEGPVKKIINMENWTEIVVNIAVAMVIVTTVVKSL